MRPRGGGVAAARRRARRPQALTAGPSFQAPAAGSGPCGSGAERGAPTAPVLHFTAQSRQGPHHCGLCAGRDLPGQPPAGAESRGGESSPVPLCADACAGAGASSVPWPQCPCRAQGISALLWGCTGKALAQRGNGTRRLPAPLPGTPGSSQVLVLAPGCHCRARHSTSGGCCAAGLSSPSAVSPQPQPCSRPSWPQHRAVQEGSLSPPE